MIAAALVVGGVVALICAFALYCEMALRRVVFDNLDSAFWGRQFEPPANVRCADGTDYAHTGGHLYGMNAAEIAYDLTCYAEDCEGFEPDALLPYVRSWMLREGFHPDTGEWCTETEL